MNRINATDASASAAIVTYWNAADGQGSVDMGGMAASDAIAELLAQCGTDEQRENILAGSFDLADDDSDDEPTYRTTDAMGSESYDMTLDELRECYEACGFGDASDVEEPTLGGNVYADGELIATLNAE